MNDGEEVLCVSNTRLVALCDVAEHVAFGQGSKNIPSTAPSGFFRPGAGDDAMVSIAMMPTASQINDPFSGVPWDPHAQGAIRPGGGFRSKACPLAFMVTRLRSPDLCFTAEAHSSSRLRRTLRFR